jgi:hypothetical protein
VNHAQRPSLVDESSSDFFFFPGGAAPTPAPAPPQFSIPAPIPMPAPVPAVVPSPAPAPVIRPATVAPRPAASDYSPQREFDAWEAAGKVGTRAAFEAFIAQYPEGRYTPQARVKVQGMAAAPAPAPAPTPVAAPAANNPQAEYEVWDRATTSNRKADLEDYLRLYPNGRYVDLVKAALKKL